MKTDSIWTSYDGDTSCDECGDNIPANTSLVELQWLDTSNKDDGPYWRVQNVICADCGMKAQP